uniref:PilZ domain-containing protein n=1 Tax=Thermodesulfobacterium geofontis TaxID=1295609 RepID=A0A7V4N376_9BACT
MEKISLTNKIKTSILIRNIQLGSLNYLPDPLKVDLNKALKDALIFHKQNLLKGTLKALNEREIFFNKDVEIPEFSEGDLVIIIIPQSNRRYVFQTIVKENLSDGYKLRILSPRHDKRLILKTIVPIFITYLNPSLFTNFIESEYYLIRNSNFSLEDVSQLNELQFYDIIFNEKNQIDEEFKKSINTYQVQGEIVDISSGGLCVKTPVILQIPENIHLVYTKFEIVAENKNIKSGLLCDLRNIRFEGITTFLHMAFLISFKPEVWKKIEEILKPLIK